jgi:hypothetical protein
MTTTTKRCPRIVIYPETLTTCERCGRTIAKHKLTHNWPHVVKHHSHYDFDSEFEKHVAVPMCEQGEVPAT